MCGCCRETRALQMEPMVPETRRQPLEVASSLVFLMWSLNLPAITGILTLTKSPCYNFTQYWSLCTLETSSPQWDSSLGVGWSPIDFPLLVFCIQHRLIYCDACSEVVFEFEWGATYFGPLRAKLSPAPLGMPTCVWYSINQYRIFFVQTSTLSPSMHQILTKHGRSCT